MGIKHYILVDGEPKDVPLMEWGRWMEVNKRKVDRTFIGKVKVSTVFLGLDHNWGDGVPILFETMVFGGEHDSYVKRYSTLEEAKIGHKKAVVMVKRRMK